MTPKHSTPLEQLEQELSRSILGQNHAISAVVERVLIGESGLATPGRPKGSFFFVGPTGVGKTELARELSRLLFQREPMRLDMAEFAAADAIKNFIGDQTGSLGRFGDLLAQNTEGIVLIDEVEKAHRDVVNVFLSVLDAARVTCGAGRTFDCSRFYFVFSSNLGALDVLRAKHLNFTQIEKHVLAQVANAFRPEFLGRIDSQIVFRKLDYSIQVDIARLNLAHEIRFLADRGYLIEFGEDVLTFLLRVGFDKYLGARPLKKAMEKYIRVTLAKERINNSSTLNGSLRVDHSGAKLRFLLNADCSITDFFEEPLSSIRVPE
jgi:ATP-dependent Clp protease ATP-binding subunit ClpA